MEKEMERGPGERERERGAANSTAANPEHAEISGWRAVVLAMYCPETT